MTVDQSGRFAEIRFAGGLVLDLKLAKPDAATAGGGGPETLSFAGKGWTLTGRLEEDGAALAVDIAGPQSYTFVARRRNEPPAARGDAPGDTRGDDRAPPRSPAAPALPHAS